MITGITEPIEFTFIFVAPALYYGIHCVLAGLSFMLMHMLNVGVGMTFSGSLIDLFLFGILPGEAQKPTGSGLLLSVLRTLYWILQLFKWVIVKHDLKTPGREDEDVEVKLYSKADILLKKERRRKRN